MADSELKETRISVVLPVFNEAETLNLLVDRLLPVLARIGPHEVIFINDGSYDGSTEIISQLVRLHPGVLKAVHFRINQGKSNALKVGFELAQHELVLMMDTDLQDQPEEIPKLLHAMREQNLDVVTGWKFRRRDPLTKTLPSRLFNRIVRRFSRIPIRDFNCGFKLIRRECLQELPLYGQLHRYILVLMANRGYRIGEVPIEHAPRRFGHSKFGTSRMFTGLMDFLTVFFLTRYVQSPLYFFGAYSMICIVFSILWGGFFMVMHFISLFIDYPGGLLQSHPIWLFSPFMMVVGFMFLAFGLLGELTFYLHLGHAGQKPIRCIEGFDSKEKCKQEGSSSKESGAAGS
ncbi:MAG: glycosyltransferase family 2 protein [Magnetococcales bacterium]|nr:glycosyltransferase family 2 protein [Magnetococcales bacterium]MBF0150718.1 glycosyltransferase family 2 protein [Magnetococcales bacterium]MBF0174425.1 glycosyltransferase family 2 protein [Magnetococcales bacterium]MBF0346939.1 glycosyltransferase family 2 protein [Magnetococcales bacterium]MBF0631672.1 glycosyltransferase family 2 protein [Magnetococcales bacterium]